MIGQKPFHRRLESLALIESINATYETMNKKQDAIYPCQKIWYGNRTLNVINGKWKVLIILALRDGNSRFSDIARSMPNITYRMLSKELKELEQSGLVNRVVFTESPLRIAYELTSFAASLNPLLDEMVSWGEQYSIRS